MSMILYDEDFPRIYQQMSDEAEQVRYYLRKMEKSALRYIAQTPSPCYTYQHITLPKTGNKYLLYYYCLNENERKHGSSFFGPLLLLNDNQGQRVVLRLVQTIERTGDVGTKKEILHVFTGHFFSRYRKRFFTLPDAKTDDVLVSFAGRNLGYIFQLPYNDIVLEKNRKVNGAAWSMDDGVAMGTSEEIDFGGKRILVAKHKTFLSPTDLKDDQLMNMIPKEVMRALLMTHYK